jgi:hypothetical protein
MRVGRSFVEIVAVFLLVSLAGIPASSAKDKFKSRIRGSLLSEYTDNLFHLSDEELAEFDDLQDPGEQFFNMESPEDIVTRLRVAADLSWKIEKKRRIGLVIRASYYAHARNSISDFPRLDAQFGYDITKKDQLYLGVNVIVDRFWKNYKVSNTSVFAPAVYDQGMGRIGYLRDIGKHWNVGVEYRRQDRQYDPPLESRDRTGNYLAAYTSYDISKKIEGGTEAHYGDIDTGVEIDNMVPEDRSYTETSVRQDFGFGFGKRTGLDLTLQYRQRNASTPFEQDLARFDRVDRRYRAGIVFGWEVTRNLLLRANAVYTRNDSDRIDPTILTDEVGYTESVFGLGLRYTF